MAGKFCCLLLAETNKADKLHATYYVTGMSQKIHFIDIRNSVCIVYFSVLKIYCAEDTIWS